MRTSILILALAAAFSNAPPGARAADTVPKFDIVKNCKAEMAATSAVGGTQASCEKDEEQARQQLIQKWAQFAKDDKLACIRETRSDGSPSYVELETCLEIATDNKARLKDSK